MKDDRLRVPLEDAYAAALGNAAYVFATLEWNAVWCCERMKAGYINTLGKKTAGKIGTNLVELSEKRERDTGSAACVAPARKFYDLVEVRNALLHAKPGTAPGGAQRLFRNGEVWSIEKINDAADAFAACSIELNALLYGELAAP